MRLIGGADRWRGWRAVKLKTETSKSE